MKRVISFLLAFMVCLSYMPNVTGHAIAKFQYSCTISYQVMQATNPNKKTKLWESDGVYTLKDATPTSKSIKFTGWELTSGKTTVDNVKKIKVTSSGKLKCTLKGGKEKTISISNSKIKLTACMISAAVEQPVTVPVLDPVTTKAPASTTTPPRAPAVPTTTPPRAPAVPPTDDNVNELIPNTESTTSASPVTDNTKVKSYNINYKNIRNNFRNLNGTKKITNVNHKGVTVKIYDLEKSGNTNDKFTGWKHKGKKVNSITMNDDGSCQIIYDDFSTENVTGDIDLDASYEISDDNTTPDETPIVITTQAPATTQAKPQVTPTTQKTPSTQATPTTQAKPVYTITYTNLPKEVNNPNPSTYKYGVGTPLKSVEAKGYKFVGWFKDGVKITYIPKTSQGNIVLKAQWEQLNKYVAVKVTGLKLTKKKNYNILSYNKNKDAVKYLIQYTKDGKTHKGYTTKTSVRISKTAKNIRVAAIKKA